MEDEKSQKAAKILKKGWNLTLIDIWPVRSAFKVATSAGIMALKQTNENKDKLKFIREAQAYLWKKGFYQMTQLVETKDGLPYFCYKNNVYILTPWVDGFEPQYKNLTHLQMAAYTLADMHQKSEGFIVPNHKFTERYGRWPKKIAKKERQIQLYRKMARHGHSVFDSLFLENADWLQQRAKKSSKMLDIPAYKSVVAAAQRGYLCHGDTAVRNLIVKDEEVYYIDFDSMTQDLPIVDLWRLLRRASRRNAWSSDFIQAVLIAYQEKRKLSQEEKTILFAFLTFPEKGWRIAHKYYDLKDNELDSAEKYAYDLKRFLLDRHAMDELTLESLGV